MPKIIPIRELKNTSKVSELCKKTDGPIFVTKNGYGDMVIMSCETFDKMFGELALYSDLAVSEQQFKEGKCSDAYEVADRIKKKYGL